MLAKRNKFQVLSAQPDPNAKHYDGTDPCQWNLRDCTLFWDPRTESVDPAHLDAMSCIKEKPGMLHLREDGSTERPRIAHPMSSSVCTELSEMDTRETTPQQLSFGKYKSGLTDSPLKSLVMTFLKSGQMKWVPSQLQPMPFEKWLSRYPPWRQEQLTKAREMVLLQAKLEKRDALVKCFLKHETSTKLTDPRNISPRTDAFLAILGPYIAAFEHHALNCEELIKGLTLKERDRKMSALCGFDAYAETDYTRFDLTISQMIMRLIEFLIFDTTFDFSEHPFLKEALMLALTTKGVSDFGWMYDIEGTRCSGDAHTSIGNALVNLFNAWLSSRLIPEGECKDVVEGDDGAKGFMKKWQGLIDFSIKQLTYLGFRVKVNYSPVIEDITFCGRFMTETPLGLVSFCDPFRTLDKFHVTCSNNEHLAGLLKAKSMSYLDTDGNTPVVGPLVWALRNVLKDVKLSGSVVRAARGMRRHIVDQNFKVLEKRNIKPVILPEVRAAFAHRTGMSIPEQIAHEKMTEEWVRLGYIPKHIPKIFTKDPDVGDGNKHVHLLPDSMVWLF